MIFRPARSEDSLNIAAIQVESYQRAYAGLLPAPYLAQFSVAEQALDWQAWFAQAQTEILLVAEDEAGELCGYALGKKAIQSFPPYQSELVALHVCQPSQGKGIARRLVIEMAEKFIGAGCTSMMCWVLEGNPARRFYERLGGKVVGRQIITLDENGSEAVEIAYSWDDISILRQSAYN